MSLGSRERERINLILSLGIGQTHHGQNLFNPLTLFIGRPQMAKANFALKPIKSGHPFFDPEEFLNSVLFVVRVPLFLAPFEDLIRYPSDAEYDVEDGVATLTLKYKPTKFLAPRPEVLHELIYELRQLPADVSVEDHGDTVVVTLKDVDRINDGYTITVTVKVLVDFEDQSATIDHYVSFAHKVV